jgi:hypothetical protein
MVPNISAYWIANYSATRYLLSKVKFLEENDNFKVGSWVFRMVAEIW